MTNEMDDILQEFLVESYENLDQLDSDLVALEQDPKSRPLLSSIFRTVHTIKGTAGFLALHRLEELTHSGENLLSALRDGLVHLDEAMTSGLLLLVDAVRDHLASIERAGVESTTDYAELVRTLEQLQTGSAPAAAPAVPAAVPAQAEPVQVEVADAVAVAAGTGAPASVVPEAPAAEPPAPAAPEVPAARAPEREEPPHEPEHVDASATGRSSVADSTVRVDVEVLDRLMTLVGELVLSRNQIMNSVTRDTNNVVARASQRLNQVVSSLQQDIMRTRMQPVDSLFSKFPRVVRGLAVSCGKEVRISFEGRDIELDRTLLEAIRDPLTHLLRNSVDHGVEAPEDRRAAGKPTEGHLVLRAQHRGGQVVLELADDGKGIDAAVIGRKAVEKGLITHEQLAAMSERECISLIFRAGFSTAEQVTNVSGRGVGMDVVKTNIEKVGGTVEIASRVGAGTTFRITIPLTLAIIPALTVQSGSEQYAIPQLHVRELVRLGARSRTIEHLQGVPVYRLRGKLLPLVDLGEELESGPRDKEPTALVVLQAGDQEFGLLVDDVHDMEEIVVKPLSKQLAAISVFAGATIVTDGRVALILDVLALALRAHAVAERHDQSGGAEVAKTSASAGRSTLLLVGVGENRRVGIPLDRVTRLEELPVGSIQQVGGRQVARYRDAILPLVRISSLLGELPAQDEERLLTIVHADQGRSVGLVVDEIHDIAAMGALVQSDVADIGLTGCVMVDQRVVELLDFESAVSAADPQFYSATNSGTRRR